MNKHEATAVIAFFIFAAIAMAAAAYDGVRRAETLTECVKRFTPKECEAAKL